MPNEYLSPIVNLKGGSKTLFDGGAPVFAVLWDEIFFNSLLVSLCNLGSLIICMRDSMNNRNDANRSTECETLVDILRQRASTEPERLAFGFLPNGLDDEIKCNYMALDQNARKIGAALQRAGLAGERAVLLYQPGPEYVCALMGCLYASVVAVPLYAPRFNSSYARVTQVVSSARAAVLLSTEKVLATLDLSEWAELRQAGLFLMATDILPEELADQWKSPAIDGDTLALLQYTSGSTGNPKGVMLCHRHMLQNSRMIARAMQCTRDSVGVLWLPPYHDMGLIGGLLQPIYSGFPVHLMSPATFLQRPIRWLEAISQFRGTISAAPNFAYELCVKRVRPEQLAALDLSSWKVAANGAEPVRAASLQRFSHTFAAAGFDARAFLPCFGMAETTLYVSGAPVFSGMRSMPVCRDAMARGKIVPVVAGSDIVELVSSGVVDPSVALRIVEPQSGQLCGAGTVGEIWLSGATVAAGYWERDQETSATFCARLPGSDANWLRTGDLGCMVDGELFVTGRIKDMIIIRGQNHYPHDIEATVADIHPALRQQGAAAFCLDNNDEEQLTLVLELERGFLNIDLALLATVVRDAVSRQHQLHIHQLMFVRPNGISKTSSGKIQRLLTRQRCLAGELPLIEPSEEIAVCL